MYHLHEYFAELVTLVIQLTGKLIYEKFYNKTLNTSNEEYFHQVVFFPDKGILQSHKSFTNIREREKNHWNKGKPKVTREYNLSGRSSIDQKSTSLIHILNVIRNARKNLSICLLIISCPELEEAVIKAKKRGVKVRILIDKSMADIDGSCIPSLQRENIPILRGPPSMMMHHKFALVDINDNESFEVTNTSNSLKTHNLQFNPGFVNKSGILMTGSFNWTWSAVTTNFENIIITNHPKLVDPYVKEFEHLWTHIEKTIYLPNSDKMEIPKYVL